MTAAILYKYYANKDELLIAIHKKAFAMLYEKKRAAAEKSNTPLERCKNLTLAHAEYHSSLRVLDLTIQVISLHNSGVLKQIVQDTEAALKKIMKDTLCKGCDKWIIIHV
ncbi:MAG: hypothetical protein KKA41_10955 [Proteobacteria bacterium]|nr:hypothetical protein [Pseudomonadota bacterium]